MSTAPVDDVEANVFRAQVPFQHPVSSRVGQGWPCSWSEVKPVALNLNYLFAFV